LVTGCVPSKALLHAAGLARGQAESASPGRGALEHVRRIRASVAHDDAIDAKQEEGIDVLAGHATFTGRNQLQLDGQSVRFKRAIIATGGRPRLPDVPGLADLDPLTSESLFELEALPSRVVMIGGGPIGCEMAQALARLGTRVTLLHRGPRLLPRDDPDASEIVRRALVSDGVDVRLHADVRGASGTPTAVRIEAQVGSQPESFEGDRVFVATGRVPNIEHLGLEAAGVQHDARGIEVDKRMRTTNRKIYAVGDVATGPQYTHAAWAQAEFATLNALFPVAMNARERPLPHVTYTDPELAHVGASMAQLSARDDVRTLTVQLSHNDRAVTEDDPTGFARVHLRGSSDTILAATVVGRGAGDLIAQMGLAITAKVGLRTVGRTVHAYPTRSEVWRDLAYAWEMNRVGPGTRRWAQRWFRWMLR
ncbi:MAG: FAD-dependent oxidoreductase, partial [Deltaproteobacteria bacterium]|nr:FAD-dependent oxidoreductase [Deltaproteobacteria bacterium]